MSQNRTWQRHDGNSLMRIAWESRLTFKNKVRLKVGMTCVGIFTQVSFKTDFKTTFTIHRYINTLLKKTTISSVKNHFTSIIFG